MKRIKSAITQSFGVIVLGLAISCEQGTPDFKLDKNPLREFAKQDSMPRRDSLPVPPPPRRDSLPVPPPRRDSLPVPPPRRDSLPVPPRDSIRQV